MELMTKPLYLNRYHFRQLLETLGPSLGLWRAAEIAALREQTFPPPVLDLGCGDGSVTTWVLPRVEIGLDPDQTALRKAARTGIYTRFEAAPAEESSLPGESVQTVLSNSVLEHISDVDGALRGAARLLCPGGRLVITSPTEHFSQWLAMPGARYAHWRNQQLVHKNLWPLDEWQQHLKAAGLELVFVRPYLRRELVGLWDALDLAQQVWIARRRVAGMIWRSLPTPTLDRLARLAAATDLSASEGGGRLMVAVKR
jgi:predicted TPR repeat methyltransferase